MPLPSLLITALSADIQFPKNYGEDVTGPGDPSVLWNAMINPLVGYSIRAALWYQGEANVDGGTPETTGRYTCYLTNMIKVFQIIELSRQIS